MLAPLSFRWRESRSTTMRPWDSPLSQRPEEKSSCLVASLSPEPFWLILSLAPWTVLDPDLMEESSDQTTLFSDKVVPVITGPRDITQKVLNWWTLCSTLSERRLKDVTASKAFNSLILLEVVPAPVWEHSSSQRSGRSIPTES